jgi:ABC-type uncharacterized transport system YnjBCD ATPase subunit
MNFAFDATIKLGDMLTIASFLGVGISAYISIRERLNTGQLVMQGMQKKIVNIQETLKLTATTLTLVATQRVEIEHLKQDIIELKHGHGFVLPFPPAQKTT